MSMIKDIKTYLTGKGVSTSIYLSQKSTKVNTFIVLYQYDGQTPLIGADIERPGLQVRSLAPDYETAMLNIKEVADNLRTVGRNKDGTDTPEEINGTLYHRIIPVQSAFPMGKDENDRHEIVQNFYVNKEW